jgi:ABA4-like protein
METYLMMKPLSKLFKISSYIALSGWVVLIGFPFWQFGHALVLSISVLLLCGIYTFLVFFGKKFDGEEKVKGSFWSFKGVVSLFKTPRVVLAGWVHYLAFDLMVGLYIVSDAANLGISHWMLLPCLFLTLMFGPAGLLAYFVLKIAVVQDFLLISTSYLI